VFFLSKQMCFPVIRNGFKYEGQ